MTHRAFENFVCIDWSGQAIERPKGLAVAHTQSGERAPTLLTPTNGWARHDILDWLIKHAEARTNALIGLDLSPGLPFADLGEYFPGWSQSPADAKALWGFVDEMAKSDQHFASTSFVKHAEASRHFRHQAFCGDLFIGGAGRMRRTEDRQRIMKLTPTSCFNLVGAAQVGKSSLTGMRVLHRLGGRIPVWPFDPIPETGPVIVEIYTSLAAREAGLRAGLSKMRDAASLDTALNTLGSGPHTPLHRYTDHATDAILTAAWLRKVAHDPVLWNPDGLGDVAKTEGWTFGVR